MNTHSPQHMMGLCLDKPIIKWKYLTFKMHLIYLTYWTSELSLLLLLSYFSRVRLCDPTDSSLPGSPVPGILQARTLEWVTISFSNAWKWKVKVKSFSRVQLFAIPWTAAYQSPPSMGFSRQEYWSEVPLPSPKEMLEKSFWTSLLMTPELLQAVL